MKTFEFPEISVSKFNTENIITTSGAAAPVENPQDYTGVARVGRRALDQDVVYVLQWTW